MNRQLELFGEDVLKFNVETIKGHEVIDNRDLRFKGVVFRLNIVKEGMLEPTPYTFEREVSAEKFKKAFEQKHDCTCQIEKLPVYAIVEM